MKRTNTLKINRRACSSPVRLQVVMVGALYRVYRADRGGGGGESSEVEFGKPGTEMEDTVQSIPHAAPSDSLPTNRSV